ncbi:hypothetical protein OROMI_016330 [Orobanche minor]
MKQLFVHVNADNKPAQDLYKKTGFKVNCLTCLGTLISIGIVVLLLLYVIIKQVKEAVEAASSPMLEDQRILMSMELDILGLRFLS